MSGRSREVGIEDPSQHFIKLLLVIGMLDLSQDPDTDGHGAEASLDAQVSGGGGEEATEGSLSIGWKRQAQGWRGYKRTGERRPAG